MIEQNNITPTMQDAQTQAAQTPAEHKPGDRAFTQADVDRIIAERLTRQKAQFADYDDLKQVAAKWAEHEEAQKTEAQKLADRATAAERARDEALARAQDMLIRSAFVAEGAKVGAVHPEDVYSLADLAGIEVDEQGNVQGVSEAVEAIVKAGRIPLAQRVGAPRLDAGAGSGARAADVKAAALSDAELQVARRMGIDPAKYAERKAAAARTALRQ